MDAGSSQLPFRKGDREREGDRLRDTGAIASAWAKFQFVLPKRRTFNGDAVLPPGELCRWIARARVANDGRLHARSQLFRFNAYLYRLGRNCKEDARNKNNMPGQQHSPLSAPLPFTYSAHSMWWTRRAVSRWHCWRPRNGTGPGCRLHWPISLFRLKRICRRHE